MTQNIGNQRNLTVAEYGRLYGPKRTKTYELIARGELKAFKDGTRTFITTESAEERRERLISESEADQ